VERKQIIDDKEHSNLLLYDVVTSVLEKASERENTTPTSGTSIKSKKKEKDDQKPYHNSREH